MYDFYADRDPETGGLIVGSTHYDDDPVQRWMRASPRFDLRDSGDCGTGKDAGLDTYSLDRRGFEVKHDVQALLRAWPALPQLGKLL